VPDLGNAWHIPDNPEPRGCSGMRDPIGAVVAGAELIIRSGNQFMGPGNAGNQLQDGSAVLARRVADAGWTEFPLLFQETIEPNKYYEARIPGAFLLAGDTLRYVLRIAYSDRDTTFVHAAADGSAVTADAAAAQAAAFAVGISAPATVGRWGAVLDLPNVAVHGVLLPTGRVLMWGRRMVAGVGDLHVQDCRPFRWDPVSEAPLPASSRPGVGLNLFCAGHAFAPDGTLLVVGGHDRADGHGLATAFVYHPDDDRWEQVADMNDGRWYPTATCLPDGGVLVTSGSFLGPDGQVRNNGEPQVRRGGAWAPVDGGPPFELYPRMHVHPAGSVVMVGPQATTWYLGTDGRWTPHGQRAATRRDYAPSAQYREDRILFLGGGNDQPDPTPTAACEILNLEDPPPDWRPVAAMTFARRHHNATVLPDGTVLVTGGTRGAAFNDLSRQAPVHLAELWNPGADTTGGSWDTLAAERRDRCYHSIALLLPDGRVLSAGGGEFQLDLPGGAKIANDPRDTHADAQIFSPPYLFAGPRPTIDSAPAQIAPGATFPVQVGPGVTPDRVTLIRLGSVTHALSMDQRFCELSFTASGTALTVTAPATADRCPPGPYLLFVLSAAGVPSVAAIVTVTAPAGAPIPFRAARPRSARPPAPRPVSGRAVTVGIDGVCPYGIGACWGGASEALQAMSGVAGVDPVPDQRLSTATVRLVDHGLPALDVWSAEFHRLANGSYRLRGFEIELAGTLDAGPTLAADADRPAVELAPLGTKIQQQGGAPQPADAAERAAFGRLAALPPGTQVSVTGPIALIEGRYVLQVRAGRPVTTAAP
jgi:galactose oxidase